MDGTFTFEYSPIQGELGLAEFRLHLYSRFVGRCLEPLFADQ
jgi:hypothetical protein